MIGLLMLHKPKRLYRVRPVSLAKKAAAYSDPTLLAQNPVLAAKPAELFPLSSR